MTLYHSIICSFKNLICHKNIFMEIYDYIIIFNGYIIFCLIDIAIFYFKVCHYWVFTLFPGFCLFFGFCCIKYNVVINMEVELSGQILYVLLRNLKIFKLLCGKLVLFSVAPEGKGFPTPFPTLDI